MKKELHPSNYRPVVFQDLNNNVTFLTKSTVASDAKITLDGAEYPLVKVYISSASHPFFTGQEKLVDIEGRVDKFNARMAAAEDRKTKLKATTNKSIEKKIENKVDEKPVIEKIGNLKRNNS
jgi:large subunit ribosomal protein L31